MNIQKFYQDDHQMKLSIEVDPDSIETARQRAARKLSRKTKIPGFRPGKAPYNVILRTIGDAAIFEEAVEILANDIYPKAIDETGIQPYGPGQLSKIESMDPLILEFLVPLDAEVTLGDYHDIRIPYDEPEVTDSDVDEFLNHLLNNHATLEIVERPVEAGDEVTLQIAARRTEVADDEDPSLIQKHSTTVIAKKQGDTTSDEWPFPGFSQNLIGMTSNDQKALTYKYPDDSDWESLRGQEAEFEILVEEIKSRNLPELNNEFAQSLGEYESVEDLTKDIHNTLTEQSLNNYKSNYHRQIIDEVVKGSTIKFPPQMLDQEIHLYLNQLENRLSQQGLDVDTYLKARGMDNEALHTEIEPLAEDRLRQTLAIFEVARKEDIHISNEEIETESSKTLAQISKYMTPEQARKAITDGYIRNLVGNISTDLLVQRTYERLEAIAKGDFHADKSSEGSDEHDPIESDNTSKSESPDINPNTPADSQEES